MSCIVDSSQGTRGGSGIGPQTSLKTIIRLYRTPKDEKSLELDLIGKWFRISQTAAPFPTSPRQSTPPTDMPIIW